MATITWTGKAGDDNYSNPANWSPMQVPTATDIVTISLAAATAINASNGAAGSLTTNRFVTLNVNNQSNFTLGSGAAATFSNGGTLALNSTNQATDLIIGAAQTTLTGGGVISLDNNGGNAIVGAASGDKLINTDNIIEGGGQLGAGTLTLINNAGGIIDGNLGTPLYVNTGAAVITNAGLMESTAGGALVLQSVVNNGTSGHITAAGGGTVYLQGADLQGGTLSTSGGSNIVVQGGFSATLDGTAHAVANTGTLAINNQGTLSVLGSIVNTGTIALQSSNQATDLAVGAATGAVGTATISGAGTLLLSDNGGNRIYGAQAGDTLVNQSTIAGAGQFGVGAGSNTLALTNQGIIDATGGNGLIIATGSTVVNSGLMEATNPVGGLVLQTTIDNSTGGTILAAGANVYVQNTTLIGGILKSSGVGAIVVQGNYTATVDGTKQTVTNADQIDVFNQGTLTALGTLTNTGTIALQSSNQATDFVAGSPTLTLTGGGTITLSDNGGNRIYGAVGTDVLDNVNNTIIGAGNIGVSQLTLVNAGTIASAGSNDLYISGDALITNTGLIEGLSGGGLVLQTTTLKDSGGGTLAAVGTNVYLQNSTVIGGLLKTGATTVIDVQGNYTGTLDGSASMVTSTGNVQVDNQGTLSVLGKLSNTGTIALNSSNQNTDLVFGPASGAAGTATLSGGGTIILDNNFGNRIYGGQAGDTLVNTNNLIEGAGQIGVSQLTFINDSTVDATGSVGLYLNTGSTVVNNGLFEATNAAGGLVIQSVVDNSGGGTILAAGGNVYLQGATLKGGLLNSSGGAVFNVQGNQTATLDGTGQAVTNKGSVTVSNQGTLNIAGSIVNNGTIALQSSNQDTDLVVSSASATLTGGGTITMDDNGGNRIYGAVGTDVLDNVNNTIVGAGQIGAGQLTLINAGTIDQTGGNNLVLNTGGIAAVNSGLLEASGTGGLVLQSVVTNTGTILAAGGNVYMQGSTIQGGLLGSSGGASFIVQGNFSATLDGSAHAITSTGSIAVQNQGTLSVLGSLVNQGTIALQSSNQDTDLIVSSAEVVLSGNGTIALDDNGGNRIYGAVAADILDNVSNTIEGTGQLGAGQLTLINGGTIAATGGGALIVNLGSTGTNTASGQMLGEGAGGLIFQNGTYTNQGLIQADNGSTVTFQAGAVLTNDSATGTLSGGTYGAVATSSGATLQVSSGAAVTTLAADLLLSGAGSEITFGGILIETSLKTIAKGGELQVLGKRDYTTKNKITSSGTVALGGGTLKAGGLNDKAGSVLSGFGTLSAKFTDAGSVIATGGELVLAKTNSITGTISGTGTLGFGGTTTLNTGTVLDVGHIALLNKATLNIAAPVSFAGTFDVVGTASVAGAGAFTNTGLFEATAKGAGTISDPFANAGTISVAANDSLAFSGGLANTGLILDSGTFTDTAALTGGSLTLGASGTSAILASMAGAGNSTLATLTTAGGALNTSGTTLTVTGDYNNTAAGTGNSYTPFAGVTGTIDGQGTKLAVIGVNGTTITSVNGTLTIAITSGGKAQFEVENTGPAGSAALRGALQTTVNGGHITGTALSGSGVTAGNYGPVAAGANTSIYTINYSSGALTNQAIHLASDFANVAGLTIDIVAQNANANAAGSGPAALSTTHPEVSPDAFAWLPALHHG